MSDELQLTVKDELWLREMDNAFDEKADQQKSLQERNAFLNQSAQRWCREAQRNRRAFKNATILAALGWAGFVAAVLLAVAREW